MAVISQKEAAKRFAKKWEGKGREQQDDSKFWLELIQDVFRVTDPYSLIEFQKPVKMESSTRRIDAFIAETRVLIEQKGVDVDLSRKYAQSGGDMLTPYEQARRYDQWMLPDEHPLWIVVCNFRSFEIHDMRHPFDEPEVVLLENLADEYHRLSFITDAERMHIQREQKVSMEAGEIVGKIYDALQKQYINPEDESAKHSLNVLCVRFVFCLYAEDAGIFGKDQFHDYLQGTSVDDMREAVLKLFDVLDTPEDKRSPYLKDVLKAFPYTNGGLFHDRDIEVPMFTDEIKDVLVEHASDDFDWSAISPTIFGAVFESTLNPETRRSNGMHYTSIENIHKVIDPLFLDELKGEYQKVKDERPASGRKDKEAEWRRNMIAFQKKLAGLKFLDPACGSGNFLTETYLSLRRIENNIIRELNDGNMNLGFEDEIIKVQISQFYGIEINDFAADVARTALWISEAQMMEETRNIIQRDMDFLPLKSNSNIHTGNALRIDWNDVIPATELNYITSNPPWIGARIMLAEQKDDLISVFGSKWKNIGNMDYVTGWYKKSLEMMQSNPAIRAALVSTNSITQGEQVANLWGPLMSQGIIINFAWRTFIWDSEASDKAHVHCVIIGFSTTDSKTKYIYDKEKVISASNINAYLVDAPSVTIDNSSKPICPVAEMVFGSMPNDGGFLSDYSPEDRARIVKDYPQSERLFHRFLGATEFINGGERWCLWLKDVSPVTYLHIPPIMDAISGVQKMRSESSRDSTRKLADVPMLFGEIRQPQGSYLLIPRHSSQSRNYIPIGFIPADVICGDANLLVPDVSAYQFGIMTSSVHMVWVKTVCGRIKSDYRYSIKTVYNNFPWPAPSYEQKEKIEQTAQTILDTRANHTDASLADMYGNLVLFPDLMKAHHANDAAVMEAYGFRKDMTEPEIVAELFKMYQKLTEA